MTSAPRAITQPAGRNACSGASGVPCSKAAACAVARAHIAATDQLPIASLSRTISGTDNSAPMPKSPNIRGTESGSSLKRREAYTYK